MAREMLVALAAAAVLAAACATGESASPFHVTNVLGDHAVLQRDGTGALVWGFGAPGTNVTASTPWGDFSTTVGADTTWRITLPPQPAGGPYSLSFTSSDGGAQTLSDILFGDVIFCSGQSNMQFSMAQVANASAEIAAAADPAYRSIRLFTVGDTNRSYVPFPELDPAQLEQPWTPASPAALNGSAWTFFSAYCWLTGRNLFNGLNRSVPMGLVASDWGGTPITDWAPEAITNACPGGYGPVNASKLGNTMVSPFTHGPMRLRAVVWDQAETDLSGETDGTNIAEWQRYGCLQTGMISAWREAFGPAPDGGPLTFGFTLLQGWDMPVEYGVWLAGLRLQQLSSLALPRVTFASAEDLSDATSPYHPVHFRDKQPLAFRMAEALLDVAYGLPGHVHAYPSATRATVVTTSGGSGGGVVEVEVGFDAATLGPAPGLQLLPEPACPQGSPYNFSAATCGFPLVLTSDGAALNATLSIPAGRASVVFTAAGAAPGASAVAVSYGWQAWPILTVYTANGYPALPFLLNLTQ